MVTVKDRSGFKGSMAGSSSSCGSIREFCAKDAARAAVLLGVRHPKKADWKLAETIARCRVVVMGSVPCLTRSRRSTPAGEAGSRRA